MKLLFDASALLNTIRRCKEDAYSILRGNLTLSLARYEVGNALWKEALLLKRLSVDEAVEVASLLDKALTVMEMVEPLTTALTLKLAYELQVTYYDASYMVASIENQAKLITDDKQLIKRIKECIEVASKTLGRRLEISSSDEILSSHVR
jgi:predicted nucleic acid-binding protein